MAANSSHGGDAPLDVGDIAVDGLSLDIKSFEMTPSLVIIRPDRHPVSLLHLSSTKDSQK